MTIAELDKLYGQFRFRALVEPEGGWMDTWERFISELIPLCTRWNAAWYQGYWRVARNFPGPARSKSSEWS
mgnify:FL=1